jgi:hypothetical protein
MRPGRDADPSPPINRVELYLYSFLTAFVACKKLKPTYEHSNSIGLCSRYSDWIRAGRSGDRIQVGVRFSAPVQTGPRAHPASCTMGTGSFPGVECGRGVTLTHLSLLVLRSKNRVELYLYSI